MKRLTVEDFGSEVQGIRLYGNPKRQLEPPEIRVVFPGGEVCVTRAIDASGGDYWVHVRVNRDEDTVSVEELEVGHMVDARLDIEGRNTTDVNRGEFADPNLYHLAVRVSRS